MKQPNLDAIRRNDAQLQALEALDDFLNPDYGDMLPFPEGLAEILNALDPIMKAVRDSLKADSQAALIGEQPDDQAKLRRQVKALATMREELLDEMKNIQGKIKAGRERIKFEKQRAARETRVLAAHDEMEKLSARLGQKIREGYHGQKYGDKPTRVKIGMQYGALFVNSDGEIIFSTANGRFTLTPEELATAKLAPLPQRKAA